MYRYERRYTGPLQAVIMDWAGTTVDFGSCAPIKAFQRLFAAEGVEVKEDEARLPMGTEKREHIRAILRQPRVDRAWKEAKGKAVDDSDIDRLYQAFVPLQIEAIEETAVVIPGLTDMLDWLQREGIAVGANTGYGREMVDGLLARAAEQGYSPASNVCATEVPKGRPWPHMALKNAIELGVSDLRACVKVDDTLTGIEEGLGAGMWTVGVAVSGNEVGLSLDAWQALSEAEQQALRDRAYDRFRRAGAHYVIDSVADLVPVLQEIQSRLECGDQP